MATRIIRKKRLKSRLVNSTKIRLSVYKSSKHIFAQLIDDEKQVTVASVHSKSLKTKSNKTETAFAVGKELGALGKKAGVESVVFDRGGWIYHGRIKSLAEGARESGLIF